MFIGESQRHPEPFLQKLSQVYGKACDFILSLTKIFCGSSCSTMHALLLDIYYSVHNLIPKQYQM